MVNSHRETNQSHQSLEDGYRAVVMGYGNMLMSAKKYSKAKELFEEYLKGNPDDSEIQSLLKKSTDILDKLEKFKNIVGKTI